MFNMEGIAQNSFHNHWLIAQNSFTITRSPPAFLMDKALATGQEMQGLKSTHA